MPVMAQWKEKFWEVSPQHIKTLENFSTSMKMMSKKAAFEPQPLSLDFLVADAAGVDVRREWEEWLQLTGKSAPFYLAGKIFGADKFKLNSADLSDIQLDDYGRMRSARISLNFKEDVKEKSKKKNRVGDYVTIIQGSAVRIGADPDDKADMKPFSI